MLRIAPWGWPIIARSLPLLAVMGGLLSFTPVWWLAWPILLALAVFIIAFFRNPERQTPGSPRDLVSPADGVVADITRMEQAPWLDEPAMRIGVFMSVFDVHVNRNPVAGTVLHLAHQPGRFLDVRHPDASEQNEHQDIGIQLDPAVLPEGRILVRQIAGLVARRIVCPLQVGDTLQRGTMFGMIRFGSRLELWWPERYAHRIQVEVGQRVQAGATILISLEAP
jgi:phosphatidylserine decarboxylase